MTLRTLSLALLVACGGKPEPDQITTYADKMCACKTIECAEKLFPELEQWTGSNEGKEVNAGTAERYNAQLTRAQKCYDDLMAKPTTK